MKVIKVGGGCLGKKETIAEILGLLAVKGRGNIVVVSSLGGITDILIDGMKTAMEEERSIAGVISRVKQRHMLVAKHVIEDKKAVGEFEKNFGKILVKLERLYYGLNFTREITPRVGDFIGSFGERFCALLLSDALRARGVLAAYRQPQEFGLITDGKYGDASANLKKSEQNFKERLSPFLKKNQVLFIPGFYGVSESGEITTFGRGGSDYSAAVITAISGAQCLEIWKDVDGFLSTDPRFIETAELISELSYDEAAELAYFGAKILHPRTVEPLRKKRLPIEIKNTLNPEVVGSRITAAKKISKTVIKSVAYTTDIGLLKVNASGVGKRKGILSEVANAVSAAEINIKSVVTSQTCISLLLAREDIKPAKKALMAIKPRPFRELEKSEDIALVAIVGEGLAQKSGIAAKCFAATADCAVNVEMISFGPSPAAMYLIVREDELAKAVTAIHTYFFDSPRCLV
jgi:aspartate kinase